MKAIISFIKSFFTEKESKIVSTRALTDEKFNDLRTAKERKLNTILEKINKSGLSSLSVHERNFLDNYKK